MAVRLRSARFGLVAAAASPVALILGAISLGAVPTSPAPDEPAQHRLQYEADTPKSILELQRFRTETSGVVRRADGSPGVAKLTNLNPAANAWYLLEVTGPGESDRASYHLENPRTAGPALRLLSSDPGVIDISGDDGSACRLWSAARPNPLDQASASGLPYAPLCGGKLYLRNPVAGRRTSLERVTDFLRDRVWGGDRVIALVKKEFYRDRFLEKEDRGASAAATVARSDTDPLPAAVTPESASRSVTPEHLGIDLDTPRPDLAPGQWYPVRGIAGVKVSVITANDIDTAILEGHEPSVSALGAVESSALVYLAAFDISTLDLHFVLGTDHPRLDWSDRPPPSSQDPRLPGPDGVGSAAPLVTNGMVSPADTNNTVATFTGGFKRIHGAFRYGALSLRNHGSHYGFVEQGTLFSKLQPGLATAVVMTDGTTDMRTWTVADDAQLEYVRYARQNGVPLIEYDRQRGRGVPGSAVNQWGAGNWSGSVGEDLRTLRAGLCLQETPSRRFLVYGYFSAATPSAMARVFQAYHCRYAMHLDMNALEHTYLALYVRGAHQMEVEHLIQGMEVLDRASGDEVAPRFLAFPDDRDFFYLTRRGDAR